MATRSQKIKVGAFLLICITLIVAVLVLAVGWNQNPTDTYHVKFTETVHIGPGSSVRYLGITIGQVTEVRITPRNEILVTIEIDRSRIQLYEGVQAAIQSVSLAGGQFVDLQGGDPSGRPLAVGSVIEADPSMMAQVRTSMPTILSEIQLSLDHINDVLGQFGTNTVQQIVADVRTLMTDADAALIEFTELMSTTRGIMVENQDNVQQILAGTIEATETLNSKLDLLDVERSQEQIIATLDSVKRVTESVETNIPGMRRDYELAVRNLSQTLDSLRQTSDSIRTLAEYLERDPAALIQGKRAPETLNP